MELKSKRDILLMTFFRKNARENLTQISRMTRIPVSTIFDKLREFEKGLIQKHTTLVDFRKLGFDIRLNMMFKISKESRENFREFLVTNEHINSVYRVNNGFDYMIEAIFKDMADLQRFTELLDRFQIEDKQELFVLEDIKRESFMSDEVHSRLLMCAT
ncbi:MAG TPA: Lrp/AsnC family transcriptional regulator [Alphaproteobacteria bacterium]|nr:Lrp/AsnC family transcriptional regulator [Alphaproteobacteria bacterium]